MIPGHEIIGEVVETGNIVESIRKGDLIGYRSYRMVGAHAKKIGFYGFGAAAHILIQILCRSSGIANDEGKKIYAFTREGMRKRNN